MRRFTWFALLAATVCAILIQVPQLIHQLDPRSQGIMVHLNSDEYVYLARVEEALSGRPEQADEAFVGDPQRLGSQSALIEETIGIFFRPTGWRAATVLQVMDSVIVFFFVLVLFFFLQECGFAESLSLIGTLLFVAIEFNTLNRPIHPGASFLLVFTALLAIAKGRHGNVLFAVFGGVLLGALLSDYPWSWSFAWGFTGLLLVWETVEGFLQHKSWSKSSRRLSLSFGLGFLAAVPSLLHLRAISHDPLYAQAAFRSGMHFSHLPESWAYSVLFFVMAASVLFALWFYYEKLRPYRLAILGVILSTLLINQEMVHGIVFNFVSHYLLGLVISAVGMLLLGITLRLRPLQIGAVAAAVYLMAVAYDGRWVITQFTARDPDFAEQHFATLLPVLDALPRTRILSDPESSAFIAGASKHDIVYSIYLKNVLMSHEEIARRFCATQLPLPPPDRQIATREWLIYPDADSAFHDPSVRQKEVKMVQDACAGEDEDPPAVLKQFGIEYVLWDEQRQPEWDLHRLHVPLTKISSGSGWSLWRIGPLPRPSATPSASADGE